MDDNNSVLKKINDMVKDIEKSGGDKNNPEGDKKDFQKPKDAKQETQKNEEQKFYKQKKFRKKFFNKNTGKTVYVPAGGQRQDSTNLQHQKTQQQSPQPDSRKYVLPNQMISVVIPLYNEEGSLMELSLGLKKVFDFLKCNYEVIFIDDGSTDKSFEKIKEIHSRNPKYKCIKFRRNYGKSAALSAGFKKAEGDIIITMDADLQDDPKEIPELVKTINSGFDLVSGWKKVRFDPFIKKLTSKIFNYFTSKISGIRLHDFNCGLKAYRKEVVKTVRIYGELHRYIPALANLSGFRVTEKIVKHHPRKFGKTKFGANRFFNGFFDLLTVVYTTKFIRKPLHLFGMVGFLFSFAGFAITLYLTLLKFLENTPLSNRPLFLVGILFIIVGIQFFSIGLLAEMITKSAQHDEEFYIEKTL
jgi:glycosyltransferase involved in cell wall biosynthesis